MADVREISDGVIGSSIHDEGNEEAFVIFADGTEPSDDMTHLVQTDENQQLAIGDDGITIVVTPENEHQVSELLRVLQASQGDDVQILTESAGDFQGMVKVKEEDNLEESEVVEPVPKKKRGRPTKQATVNNEALNKKAKLIELALQEADASVAEDISSLKSSRLREKAAKQGGLKKLWLTLPREDSPEEINVESDPIEVKSDGEGETHLCEMCPEEEEFASVEDLKNHRKEVHPASFHCDICGIGFEDQIGFFEHLKTHYEKMEKPKKNERTSPQESHCFHFKCFNFKIY